MRQRAVDNQMAIFDLINTEGRLVRIDGLIDK